MRRLLIILFLLANVFSGSAATRSCCQCLPKGIKGSDVVSVLAVNASPGKSARVVTVKQKLVELKAHCKRGKLFDGSGREIYFFQLAGCWGNPPENYQEVLDEQARKLEQLKKRYTVVEMTCNPSGEMIN